MKTHKVHAVLIGKIFTEAVFVGVSGYREIKGRVGGGSSVFKEMPIFM
jgi:hypothetical protein